MITVDASWQLAQPTVCRAHWGAEWCDLWCGIDWESQIFDVGTTGSGSSNQTLPTTKGGGYKIYSIRHELASWKRNLSITLLWWLRKVSTLSVWLYWFAWVRFFVTWVWEWDCRLMSETHSIIMSETWVVKKTVRWLCWKWKCHYSESLHLVVSH